VIGNCIARLLPQPRVGAHNLPSTGIVTVRHQNSNLVVHLLHYVHQRRGKILDIIEDVIPLHDVEISIRAEREPLGVRLVPEDQAVEWRYENGYVSFGVPVVNGYQIVEIVNGG
jgi:hypothetical protein